MPLSERYTLLSLILALSTTLLTQFFLRDWKHVNFDQILRIKMAELPLPVNNVQMGPYEQFILFGDSITQMSCAQDLGFAWTPALQNVYIRNLDVINRGFNGYNTTQALKALPLFMPTLIQAKIRFMTIFFGANDAVLPDSPTHQHVPLQEYKENLRSLITHETIEAHQPRIILITPGPVDEYQFFARQRTAEHTKLYADACREIGKELGVPVLDLWSVFMAEAGWRKGEPLLHDGMYTLINDKSETLETKFGIGLHFNPKAYKLLFEATLNVIRREWPDQDPTSTTNMPLYRIPEWRAF